MRIAHCRLKGLSGHEAGRALLRQLYREETGEDLPKILITDRGKPYFVGSSLHFSISGAAAVNTRRKSGAGSEVGVPPPI